MRKVTVKRKKSFVGSVMKMYVYLLSSEGDVNIGGRNYKLMGTLKNKGSLTFEISDGLETIHMCYWKSETFYPAVYNAVEDNKDLVIEVKAKFSPSRGNPITIISVSNE